MGDAPVFPHCSLLRNLWSKLTSCDALLWRRNKLLVLHFLGYPLLTASLRRKRMSMYISLSIVVPSGTNLQGTMPWQSKHAYSINFLYPFLLKIFCYKVMAMIISIQKTAVLFVDHTWSTTLHPVITLLRNLLFLSAISMRSLVMFIHVSLCSCASIQSTKCWQMRRMFNASWRIVWQPPIEIPTSNAIWFTDFLLLLLTISGTCLTFTLSVDIDGWPLHRSSSTLSHPSWKHLCQTHICDFFIALSPYTCCNVFHISAGDFRS